MALLCPEHLAPGSVLALERQHGLCGSDGIEFGGLEEFLRQPFFVGIVFPRISLRPFDHARRRDATEKLVDVGIALPMGHILFPKWIGRIANPTGENPLRNLEWSAAQIDAEATSSRCYKTFPRIALFGVDRIG